jgi:hypothetical protein
MHRPAPEANLFGFGVAKYVRDTSSSLKIPLSKIKDSGCQRFGGAITRQIVRDSAAGSLQPEFLPGSYRVEIGASSRGI